MPTYLYGLILSRNAHRVPPDVSGVDDLTVRVAQCDGVSALVGGVTAPPSRQNVRAIAAHDIALTRVVRHGVTVASSRFGQTFAHDAAVCDDLRASPHRERLMAMLERYDGYGEMRVAVRDVIVPPATLRASIAPLESPGRAYLESLREKLGIRPQADVRSHVSALVLEERVERRGDVQTIVHLVRFEHEARYRAALFSHPALEGATITGPHALYTFAEPG